MTPGTEPALTPDEWLGGINRGTSAGPDRQTARKAGAQARHRRATLHLS